MEQPKLGFTERTAFEQATFLVRQLESIISSLGHLKDHGVLIYDSLYHRILVFPEGEYTLRDSAIDLHFLIKEIDRLFFLLRKVLADGRLSSDRRLALYDHLRELSASYHVIVPEVAHFNPFELYKGHLAIKLSKMGVDDEIEQLTRQFEKPHLNERLKVWEERGKEVSKKEKVFRILQIVGTTKIPGLIDILHEKVDEGFRSLQQRGHKDHRDPFYGLEVIEIVSQEVHEAFFRKAVDPLISCEKLIKNLGELEWKQHGHLALHHFMKLSIELFYVLESKGEGSKTALWKIEPGSSLAQEKLMPWLKERVLKQFPSLLWDEKKAEELLLEVNLLREKTWEHAKRYERA